MGGDPNQPRNTDGEVEFFFRLPFNVMDVLWYAQEHDVPVSEAAQVMGLEDIQVQRAFNDFSKKRKTTQYLRTPTIFLDN